MPLGLVTVDVRDCDEALSCYTPRETIDDSHGAVAGSSSPPASQDLRDTNALENEENGGGKNSTRMGVEPVHACQH